MLNFTKKWNVPALQLTLNGIPLTETSHTKFLGLIFNKTLTWQQQIQKLRQKCFHRLNFLKVLNGTSWGADKKCFLRIYYSHIRSILDYGSMIYSSASPSTLKKFDTIQNQAFRIASRVFRTSPIASINAELNTMPLQHRRHTLLLQYFGKLINSYWARSFNHPGSLKYTADQLLATYNISADKLMDQSHPNHQCQLIQLAVHTHMQQIWTTDPHPYLFRVIKPHLQPWRTSFHYTRQTECVITCARLGHTRLTHLHLILRTEPPICDSCQTPATLLHLLNDCHQYTPQRLQHYGSSPHGVYDSLSDNRANIDIFVSFLKATLLYSSI